MKDRKRLIARMAAALQPLSAEMLESGTARWGAYELAGLVNVNDRWRPDPSRINAHTEGIVHTPLDEAAVHLEKESRASGASGASGALLHMAHYARAWGR
jgi:hypothetical protein